MSCSPQYILPLVCIWVSKSVGLSCWHDVYLCVYLSTRWMKCQFQCVLTLSHSGRRNVYMPDYVLFLTETFLYHQKYLKFDKAFKCEYISVESNEPNCLSIIYSLLWLASNDNPDLIWPVLQLIHHLVHSMVQRYSTWWCCLHT